VTTTVVPRLERITGVRDVAVSGVADERVTVTLDLARLGMAGLTPADVSGVLRANGVVLPAGTAIVRRRGARKAGEKKAPPLAGWRREDVGG